MKIKAGIHCDAEGKPKAFTLSQGGDQVTLEPGKTWIKADTFKWVTRGLIEPPQSFHVQPNGTVEINGEKISLEEREGVAKLEQEINKQHVAAAAPKRSASPISPTAAGPVQQAAANKVVFHIRLDTQGHLMIACSRGTERVETGLRGLTTLIQNGFMLKPNHLHVDAMQRSIEIDGIDYECNEHGARQLEAVLNTKYAPSLKSEDENAIEIKENPASPTGFDIHFVTSYSGLREEVKGHLSQEKLDVLQDSLKCGLLQPGIVLRLSPPFLLIRRRKSDGGEEKVPEVPDIQYRRITLLQLQQVFNHPAIRKTTGKTGGEAPIATTEAACITEIQVVKNTQNPGLLWLKCLSANGAEAEAKAFTHHNIADLQHRGIFRSNLDAMLSLDNRTLNILDKETHQEQVITVDIQSGDEDLAKASRLLTAALKPPVVRPVEAAAQASPSTAPAQPKASAEEDSPPLAALAPAPSPAAAPMATSAESASLSGQATPAPGPGPVPAVVTEQIPVPPAVNTPPANPSIGAAIPVSDPAPAPPPPTIEPPLPVAPSSPPPTPDAAILGLFGEADSRRINQNIFQQLKMRASGVVLDIRLSLPRVFENRRFEIISFSHTEIENVIELHSEQFIGFYLSHINEHKILLVYACLGKHIEWGPEKNVLRAAVSAEPWEFKGNALRGLAQDPKGNYIFVVESAFKEAIKTQEKPFHEASVLFLTASDLAAAPSQWQLIWPERSF